MNLQSVVLQRQLPLRAQYKERPAMASIVKRARSHFSQEQDALHGAVVPGEKYGVTWQYGIDHAVGGFHDAPNPAEMLVAALAACQLASVRMVADVLGVRLEGAEVEVTGHVDVRGSLGIDRTVPAGFASIQSLVRVDPAAGTPPEMSRRLIAEAERSCINLQTLRAGTPVDVRFEVREGAEHGTS